MASDTAPEADRLAGREVGSMMGPHWADSATEEDLALLFSLGE